MASEAAHEGFAFAVDFIHRLRTRQEALAAGAGQDAAFSIPFTTIHAGIIAGGVALNIVPDRCTVDFEIRNLASDSPDEIIAAIQSDADAMSKAGRAIAEDAAIRIEMLNGYPGLDTPLDGAWPPAVKALAERGDSVKVDFGTEGGLIHRRLACPTVICGPGSMVQGHKADEFITPDQIMLCDRAMDRIVDYLAS